jgi:hypothetical protein
MFKRVCGARFLSAKRRVPFNCRTPTQESTKLSDREKLEWAGFIALLTVVPIGFQLWQFYATSSVVVNQGVAEELSRRNNTTASPAARQQDATL